MNENLRIRIIKESGSWWNLALCVDKKILATFYKGSEYKSSALRSAERLSKNTGIPFSLEIMNGY